MANILVESGTGRVVYITEGTITLDADNAATPDRVFATHNSSNATIYNGVNPPTTHGGRYTYDGSDFTDTWPYRYVTRLEFIDMLQTHAGVTDANLVAAKGDANLAALWLKLDMAVSIARDSAVTMQGLDALVATGYIDAAGKQAVLDNWGREQP